jgi:hypothetical protein
LGAGADGAGDHGVNTLGQASFSSTGIQRIDLNEAGVAAVQAWLNEPQLNHGLIIKNYSVSDGFDISTSEASNASLRPKLIIQHVPVPPMVLHSATLNGAVLVDAGPDRTAPRSEPVVLNGAVNDGGQPADSSLLTVLWSRVSGPGTATFGDASSVSTTVEFSAAGNHVLRLTVSDGGLSAFDELTVTVS